MFTLLIKMNFLNQIIFLWITNRHHNSSCSLQIEITTKFYQELLKLVNLGKLIVDMSKQSSVKKF